MSTFDILLKYHNEFLRGLAVTLELCAYVYPIGIILGTGLGIVRHKWRMIGALGFLFSLIVSSTPILVLLFWLHYPLQYMMQVVIDPFVTSVVALVIIMTGIVSNQVKNALDNFPHQYILSARVCGLKNWQIVRYIQLPIIAREMLPNFLFAMVVILQASLFSSMIGLPEIFRVAQQVNSEIYKPVEIYTSLAIFFICVCAALNLVGYWLKQKIRWTLTEI